MALHVGITGGIGSGKTLVCKLFATLGIPVYYADDRAKEILQNDGNIITAVKELLGDEAYLPDGTLNRRFIASQVFDDAGLLAQYNAIIHPAVIRDADDWMRRHDSATYVLKEAALLFESGSYKTVDKIICITAPEALRIARVRLRDNVSEQEVRQRMNNQWSDASRIALSDFVIHNDGTAMLIPQVVEIHRQLLDIGSKKQ